jgi:glycosyltransferase involved in cell wall biosynthesis
LHPPEKKLKFLIGPYDIAGFASAYKKGLEANGHKATTAVALLNDFYDHNYDIDLIAKQKSFFRVKHLYGNSKIVAKLQSKLATWRYRKLVYRLIDQHDVILTFWHPFLEGCAEFDYIKKKNKKLIRVFVGSDARYFPAFQQEFDVSHWCFPSEFVELNLDYLLTNIRKAERHADLIYSVPDQSSLQLKPYYHLQVPIALEKIRFQHNDTHVPLILHAPSIPYKKGSDIIERTLDELMQEGLSFNIKSVRNLANEKLMNLLSEADIVVDELVFHGPGALSFEAMASGCAVATRYLENSPNCFRPPILPIDANTIKEQLRRLITDKQLRDKLITDGRRYVEQHNTAEKITSQIIEDLHTYREPDYHPTFLRNHYNPLNGDEVKEINNWTRTVKDCDWYAKNITPGERDGLIF